MKKEKILRSKSFIRFQDCDPFQHLNNANYINYFINAREDHVRDYYGIDVYGMAKNSGVGWVVTQNQIAYLRPVMMLETVTIESQMISFGEKTVTVEIRMLNEAATELRAFMWSVFIYVDIRKNNSVKHPQELMELFNDVCEPLTEKNFERRVAELRK